ncbi:hypothetical protein Dsin_017062 [Dipteronia sinensis]|uniref:Homeobox domain-containing protein n=1 Tax=Dipteronia sinensis TaxID=43782 RepID=A0AAE0AEV1_9ROSI|nr:hypothetical protein Dsin_017062 [Dipteronia sinensis]
MAFALSTSASTSGALQSLFSSGSSHNHHRLFAGDLKPPGLVLPRHTLSRSTLAFSRRRNQDPAIKSSSSKKKMKKKSLPRKDENDDDDTEDDPFELLFSLLEEDLKNDTSTVDDETDDEEINEEDIDKLAQELAEALGDGDMELFNSATNAMESNDDGDDDDAEDEEEEEDKEEEDEEEEEEERQVPLKNWQLRKLAYALKAGRRKVSIKNLAAELCLDRAIVIEMLRDPPPHLLMLSATLPDEPPPVASVSEVKQTETVTEETTLDAVEPESVVKEPVHIRQSRWLAQKRLKKVQIKTLEMVYRKSKRPTNALISSIVQVTNLPRKRIVQWFEEKRAEEGVPERHAPYRRSDPETVFTR